MRDIRALPLPSIPPLAEQRAVAEVLGVLDDKIEANRALNETLEATCQALFRSWFVDFDPVVAKSEGRRPAHLSDEVAALFPDTFQDSPIGPVPQSWEAGNLGHILELAYGKALPERSRTPGKFAVYGSNGVVGSHTNPLVTGPGIVVGRKGSAGCVVWSHEDFFPIDTTYFVRSTSGFPLTYLFHALRSLDLESFAGDSAVPGLNRELTYLLKVVIPPLRLAERFGQAGDTMFKAIHQHQSESKTLEALRDVLLPRLLSGELRAKQADRLVEAAV